MKLLHLDAIFYNFIAKNLSSGRRSFLPPDNGPTMQRYENKNLRENDNHKCGRRFVRNAYPTICRQLLRFVSFQLFQGFATSLRTWPAVLWKTKTWQRTKSQQIWSECCAAPKAVKLVLAYFLNFAFFLNLPPWGEWWIPGINAMKILAENMPFIFRSNATNESKTTIRRAVGPPIHIKAKSEAAAASPRRKGQWAMATKEKFLFFFISYISCLQSFLAYSVVEVTSAGLEPAIPGSVGRCLIHWATRPLRIFFAPRAWQLRRSKTNTFKLQYVLLSICFFSFVFNFQML